ncbi:hypothetical protein [Hyella patelloides]|nr:hypothetical protein [Hyella patelloides]
MRLPWLLGEKSERNFLDYLDINDRILGDSSLNLSKMRSQD